MGTRHLDSCRQHGPRNRATGSVPHDVVITRRWIHVARQQPPTCGFASWKWKTTEYFAPDPSHSPPVKWLGLGPPLPHPLVAVGRSAPDSTSSPIGGPGGDRDGVRSTGSGVRAPACPRACRSRRPGGPARSRAADRSRPASPPSVEPLDDPDATAPRSPDTRASRPASPRSDAAHARPSTATGPDAARSLALQSRRPDRSRSPPAPRTRDSGGLLVREGAGGALDPGDEYGLELALQLAEAGGGEVTVVSMGPPEAVVAVPARPGDGPHCGISRRKWASRRSGKKSKRAASGK